MAIDSNVIYEHQWTTLTLTLPHSGAIIARNMQSSTWRGCKQEPNVGGLVFFLMMMVTTSDVNLSTQVCIIQILAV